MTAGQVLEYGALVSRRDELRQLQENEEVTAELNLIEERIKELGLNEEKERKQIWIIRWQSGRIRSEYGTYEEAKQVAEEIGGEYIIV